MATEDVRQEVLQEALEEQDLPNIQPPGEAVEAARGLSLIQHAAKEREAREANLFLDVPSWRGDLVAEYRVLRPRELDMIGERAAKRMRNGHGQVDAILADIELIARACVGLHAVDPESGDRIPIEDEHGVVGYGRICDVLGRKEIETNAEAIRYVMGRRDENGNWEENQTAISSHSNTIARWMRDPSKRSTSLEELLGEL